MRVRRHPQTAQTEPAAGDALVGAFREQVRRHDLTIGQASALAGVSPNTVKAALHLDRPPPHRHARAALAAFVAMARRAASRADLRLVDGEIHAPNVFQKRAAGSPREGARRSGEQDDDRPE